MLAQSLFFRGKTQWSLVTSNAGRQIRGNNWWLASFGRGPPSSYSAGEYVKYLR